MSDACRRLGVSRRHCYDIKKAIEEEGVEGLLETSRQSPRLGLRIPSTVKDAILAYSLERPNDGHQRVGNDASLVTPHLRCAIASHRHQRWYDFEQQLPR
jgi:hypothetical protein